MDDKRSLLLLIVIILLTLLALHVMDDTPPGGWCYGPSHQIQTTCGKNHADCQIWVQDRYPCVTR